MYKLIINEGQGFTEMTKTFYELAEAVAIAYRLDNVKIYKNNKRIY